MRPDMRTFIRNRETFPPGELLRYKNEWIAWSSDGQQIVAHSPESDEAVYDLIVAAGLDPSQCVVDFVPDPDLTSLGSL